MKENTKPTQEEKQQYFAAYYMQYVLIDNIGKKQIVGLSMATRWCGIEKSFLELTHLSNITDEDYTELMMRKYPSQPWVAFKVGSLIPEMFNQEQTDYLRSRGYALPWMGYSVEQLISFGWLKLKEKGDSK